MDKPRVAIIVGHHGHGTGASIGSRDEWELASRVALGLVSKAVPAAAGFTPILVEVDRDSMEWTIIDRISRAKFGGISLLDRWKSIDYKIEKARSYGVEAAVEIHFNRFAANTLLRRVAEGNEIFIRRNPDARTLRLGELLQTRFQEELGNRPRGLKRKNFRLLRKLSPEIPAAILEPGFLAEDRIVSLDWQARLRLAISRALSDFFQKE